MSERADMPDVDVTPDQWAIVRDILSAHVPQWPVWAFGSRTTGTAKPYSDLDIAVITTQPLGLQCIAALAEAFSESELSWKVDIVDWSTTSERFRRIIEGDRAVLQPGKPLPPSKCTTSVGLGNG